MPELSPDLHAVRDGLALPAHAIADLNRAAAATPAIVAIELDASGRPQRVTRRSGPAANQVAAALAEAAIESGTFSMPPVCVRTWTAVIVVIGCGDPFSPHSSPVPTRRLPPRG